MQGDMPDGSFSAEELARLEAAGVIERIQPGTPEAASFDREMVEQLAAADAELLEREGPDALTSDRYLRQTALAIEQDPTFVGHAFARWCQRRGWERSDLADYLGVTLDQLAAMAISSVAGTGEPMSTGDSHARALAERFGADPGRLAEVLGA